MGDQTIERGQARRRPGGYHPLPRAARRSSAPGVPVFVDESGQRRRLARIVGGGACLVVAGYLALVGLTLAGAPGTGQLRPPGMDALARPAGGSRADVGPRAREQALPAGVASSGAGAGGPGPLTASGDPGQGLATSGAGSSIGSAGATTTTAAASATTVASTTTSTTRVPPGQTTKPSLPPPSSTLPSGDHGPPVSKPGHP